MRTFVRSALVLGTVLLLHANPASALNQHSFVASTGNDANACTLDAPCLTFQAAVNATVANGELEVLDSADFGSFTVSNPITIINNIGFAGVLQTGGGQYGIDINTSGQVVLKGLTIEGNGSGGTGIRFRGTGTLIVSSTRIAGFTTAGLSFLPSGSATLTYAGGSINNISGGLGVNVAPSALGSTDVVRVLLEIDSQNNATGVQVLGDGLNASAKIFAVIQNGNALNNTTGINVQSSGAITKVFVGNDTINGNTTGLQVSGAAASLTLGGNTIMGNVTPTAAPSGVLNTFNNNSFVGNTNAPAVATQINKH
jgi:hypothetical protein